MTWVNNNLDPIGEIGIGGFSLSKNIILSGTMKKDIEVKSLLIRRLWWRRRPYVCIRYKIFWGLRQDLLYYNIQELPKTKMELPKFNRKGLQHWLFKVRQYFACQQVHPIQWIWIHTVYFEDEAMKWFILKKSLERSLQTHWIISMESHFYVSRYEDKGPNADGNGTRLPISVSKN